MSVTIETYLETVIDERIVPMLKEVSASFSRPVEQVERYVKMSSKPPFWWIYPGGIQTVQISAGLYAEITTVTMRLILGNAGQSGYNGQLEGDLWKWLPTVNRYFQERRGLVFQPGQSLPDHLEPKGVVVGDFTPLGLFEDGTGQIGTETTLTMPFSFYITPYPGNP